MRKLSFFFNISICLLFVACNSSTTGKKLKLNVITDGLRYCEGSVAYGNDILISNFGCETFNPLNEEGKGYIIKLVGDSVTPFIPSQGYITAPKGMALAKNHLFIADVGKVVIYNIDSLDNIPQTIIFPEGNLFINDIVVKDNEAFVSVTNTGNIFKIDISNIDSLNSNNITPYISIPGANGMVLDGNKLYIASYPPDGITKKENTIYIINDINNPYLEKFIDREGQYDGLALYNSRLYFTNWVNNEIGYVDLQTKEIELFLIEDPAAQLTGPADITILNNKLYIPNLPSSEVIVVNLDSDD